MVVKGRRIRPSSGQRKKLKARLTRGVNIHRNNNARRGVSDANNAKMHAIEFPPIGAYSSSTFGVKLNLAGVKWVSRVSETLTEAKALPDQVHKPTTRPTMRWVFQCFEGIEPLHVQTPTSSQVLVLRLQLLHRLILQLFGPLYEKFYQLASSI
jgi:hypothetical protein